MPLRPECLLLGLHSRHRLRGNSSAMLKPYISLYIHKIHQKYDPGSVYIYILIYIYYICITYTLHIIHTPEYEQHIKTIYSEVLLLDSRGLPPR